jgi:hypothetical protein
MLFLSFPLSFFLPFSVCVFSVLSSFLFYSFSFFLFFLLSLILFCLVKHETRIRSLETKNKEQEKQLMSQVRTNKIPVHSELLLRIRMFILDSDFLPSGSRIPNLTRTKNEERGIF